MATLPRARARPRRRGLVVAPQRVAAMCELRTATPLQTRPTLAYLVRIPPSI